MPKKFTPSAQAEEMKLKFQERVGELWDEHQAEFLKVLGDSESSKLNLTFVGKLDFTDSAAKLVTSMSFSQVVKDSREDDFAQLQLPGVGDERQPELDADGNEEHPMAEAATAPKRGRGRPRKDAA